MSWRTYLQITLTGFREQSIYRLNAVTSLLGSLLFLLLMYYIWTAIAAASTLARPVSQIIIYLAVAQVVREAAGANVESFIGDRVRRGTIVNELKRPVSLRAQVFFNQVGKRLFHAATKAVPIMLVLVFYLGGAIPAPLRFAAFGGSLVLAFLVTFALSYAVGMLIFWTKVGWSLRMTRNMLTDILGGAMFPLYLLPASIKPIFYALPFHAMVNAPVTIFTGDTAMTDVLGVYMNQLVWLAVLVVAGELLWQRASSMLTVQGG